MLKVGNGWDSYLAEEYEKEYFANLERAVADEYDKFLVFPPKDKIYTALCEVPYDQVKVVILGQDPYHGEGQAVGRAFAVGEGVDLPPSLVNIFKEIESDIGVKAVGSTLKGWAEQGVLLLNTVLTVRAHQAQSHSNLGWQEFTDAIITKLAQHEKPMVFILWGANAIKKKPLIPARHKVLSSVHPSPLSAYRGFFGCRHFSKANEFLSSVGESEIDWANIDGAKKLSGYYSGKGSITRANAQKID
ncbi:MAG: uracil-DNA glycosylase [Clostridia bacterium]|nr:uracil-DNA glycosylase [Clostridia bacterium]